MPMTRRKKGMWTTLLVMGILTVVAAFNSEKIKEFVNDKLPFIAKIFNKS